MSREASIPRGGEGLVPAPLSRQHLSGSMHDLIARVGAVARTSGSPGLDGCGPGMPLATGPVSPLEPHYPLPPNMPPAFPRVELQ